MPVSEHTQLGHPPMASHVARADEGRAAADVHAVDHPVSRLLARASLALTLAAAAVLYIAGLSASGWANSFYSAAAQAGSKSWEALFYGSLDAANSITVDKPPAAMWVMGLSVRLFGLNSWSILVPEALMGVASIAVVYASVRRVLGFNGERVVTTARAHWAALAGAIVFGLTPVATLMFRFNNPDALLVLTECIAAYMLIRATERASRRWLMGAGVMIGLGFLAKMLQAFIVLPAFVIAYAIFAPASWKRKLGDLLAAFAAMLLSFGWYVAVVELVPASSRPYIGGSQTNSLLELIFGYNGVGRLTGNETGSVTGGTGGAGAWGATGITRMFDSVSGGMVSWLIPAALILTVAAFAALGRRTLANAQLGRRPGTVLAATPATQAASGLVVFTGWLVITGLVFSYMAGIYHDYYTVALAPAIGASVGIGAGVLWHERHTILARIGLALAVSVTGIWAARLTLRAGGTYTTLGGVVVILATLAAVGLLVADLLPKALGSVALATAFAAAVAGPLAYSLNTARTPHTGSIVTAGPVSGTGFGGRGRFAGGRTGGFGRGGFAPGQTGNGTGQTGVGQRGGLGGLGGGGGAGGLLNGVSVSAELKALLESNASSYTWVAATVGSQGSASYQLATGDPVMAIGGFNGSDNSPTLAQFKALVAAGKIHYYIAGGMSGQSNGGSSAASEINSWVTSTFTATTVGSTTVYDLTTGS